MRRLFFIILCLSLLLIAGTASACGGFFCSNLPIDQSAERIIFTVNDDDTLTAIVGINYVGAAEDFSWIVPVPSVPELDVTETSLLDTLQTISTPNFVNPPNYCSYVYYFEGAGGGGGGGGFLETGAVGPYDFAVLQSISTSEVVNWLRNNGYQVTDEMIPLIDVYVQEGMYFLALRLSKDSEVGDIQPVVMTYKSTKPMIPIRLTAVAAIPDMPILTWILADTQYVPENFTHGQVDFGTFRAQNRSQMVGRGADRDLTIESNFNSSNINASQYVNARDAIQDENKGLAFITEFAMPSQAILESDTWDPESSPELVELLNAFPYVTRLRAQMSPEEMTLDPTFIPAPDAPDRPASVMMGDYIDPLHYFGCSSREALDEATWTALPDGLTRIDDLSTSIAHPNDWNLSQFVFEGKDVWVFSPEFVSADDIYATFLQSPDAPPMFVLLNFAQRENPDCRGGYMADELLWDVFNISYNSGLPPIEGIRTKLSQAWYNDGNAFNSTFPGIIRVEPFNYDCVTHQGYVAYMLADEAEWQANADMYWAMLRFAESAYYETDAELRETLILGNRPTDGSLWVSPITIGFPEGMIEHWVGDGSVLIDSKDEDLTIQLIPLSQYRDSEDSFPVEMVESLFAEYNVDESVGSDLVEAIAPYTAQAESPVVNNVFSQPDYAYCLPELPSVRFEGDASYGYLRFEYNWLAVVKTSIGSSIPEDLLMTIADSMQDPVLSCEEWQARQDEFLKIMGAN